MIIFLCVLAWLAFGFLAVWLKWAIVDQRKHNMTVVEGVVMSLFGPCLLFCSLLVLAIVVPERLGGAILFKAKND